MNSIKLNCLNKNLNGVITLSGSKSISNRVLLIRALCEESFQVTNLSDSDDTVTLERLLNSKSSTLDAHHAGTTFRFLTAFLATKPGSQILTGSERMKQRPIKALVDALNLLGADIEYLESEGYPPIKINTPKHDFNEEITLPANISSQYITALLLIAPTLPKGIMVTLEGKIVSRPYIEMTIKMMEYFGISVDWEMNQIIIKHQKYNAKDYYVEADWSAASYYYILAGLSETANITLNGVHANSLQGDSAIAEIGTKFGIETIYEKHQIRLIKEKSLKPIAHFEYDFIEQPDIAQSISVLSAGLGVNTLYSGLQTLKIKETDRILALQQELAKIGVHLNKMPSKFSKKSNIEYYLQEGKATINNQNSPSFDTYNDHRMAMAFAPLAILFPIIINEPMVVSKSYPKYWEDLKKLGFSIDV